MSQEPRVGQEVWLRAKIAALMEEDGEPWMDIELPNGSLHDYIVDSLDVKLEAALVEDGGGAQVRAALTLVKQFRENEASNPWYGEAIAKAIETALAASEKPPQAPANTQLICQVCKQVAGKDEWVGIVGCSKCNPVHFTNAASPGMTVKGWGLPVDGAPWALANTLVQSVLPKDEPPIVARLVSTRRNNEDDEETVAYFLGPNRDANAKSVVDMVNALAAQPPQAPQESHDLRKCLRDLSEVWQAVEGDSPAEKCMRSCGVNLEDVLDTHSETSAPQSSDALIVLTNERIRMIRLEEAKWWHMQRGHHGKNWCCERIASLERENGQAPQEQTCAGCGHIICQCELERAEAEDMWQEEKIYCTHKFKGRRCQRSRGHGGDCNFGA